MSCQPVKDLYLMMANKNFDKAYEMIKKDSGLLLRIGYVSAGCSGSWGMPIYKHFGALLEKEKDYAKDDKVLDFARFVIHTLSFNDTEDESLILYLNYAVVANWIEIVRELLYDKNRLTIEDAKVFLPRAKSQEMTAVMQEFIDKN